MIYYYSNNKGEKKWVRSIANPVLKANKLVKIQGSFIDITDEKNRQMEKEIFTKALDSSSDAIGMSTAHGFHFYQNKTFNKKVYSG